MVEDRLPCHRVLWMVDQVSSLLLDNMEVLRPLMEALLLPTGTVQALELEASAVAAEEALVGGF